MYLRKETQIAVYDLILVCAVKANPYVGGAERGWCEVWGSVRCSQQLTLNASEKQLAGGGWKGCGDTV